MNVVCENCRAVFRLDKRQIKPKGAKVRCSRCGFIFEIETSDETSEIAPQAQPSFEIIRSEKCPLYKIGDEFQLSDKIFLPPYNKPPCFTLVKDLMKISRSEGYTSDKQSETIFSCSGCSGKIRFAYKPETVSDTWEQSKENDALVTLLSRFPIFEELEQDDIRNITSLLKLDRYDKGEIVLKKGEFGRFLYIILTGRVDVLDGDDMSIASMGKGEIFGEMSLLSGAPVGSTIKASESAALLRINGEDFKKLLIRLPKLHKNFMHLLIRRMSEINMTRTKEYICGITGKLSEMPPPDLFQTFNVSEKTGKLTLKFPDSTAYLSFREGQLVQVKFREKQGEEAFFELLKQKEGRFKFTPGLSPDALKATELGDFMGLLIEGLRRIDEEDKNFLRTVIPKLV